ncbi:endonuclease/exonuclease/phosphatase family protein [Streptomyces kunmingensis]|uniref:Endonuclease/exonuclease/phosphatase family protein n=1 Tax=Streptomyces kunmingensis TaxID=68225 RepID=A0ABU6CER6_9ACTN|nr:endonuclease/exonuclease/phosphatase family protein [Streptomyces kunmingensis]MEB3963191.1 endonuclease/exonuclease/phosphatase family protein [Streptomyces kunmingensis]
MRILTLNTWGTRGDWREREARFRDCVEQLAPDILTLQETVHAPGTHQALRMLGEQFHIADGQERESGRPGAPQGQGITTASRWPFGRVVEVDLNLTDRTGDFACTCLITEILAPHPLGRIWVAHHFPDYQLDHELERCLQAAAVARKLEELVKESPGHVVIAGDLDAEADADSVRFLTGRHVIDGFSVCYRNAWEAVRPHEPLTTYSSLNPYRQEPDWPFHGIDHVMVRCATAGPTLLATSCRRVFDVGTEIVSDHYGLAVDYEVASSTW